jgi:hypothetical protein
VLFEVGKSKTEHRVRPSSEFRQYEPCQYDFECTKVAILLYINCDLSTLKATRHMSVALVRMRHMTDFDYHSQ